MPIITVKDPTGREVSFSLHHDVISIGRGPENTLSLPDAGVSRAHAEIRRDGSAWTIRDRGSKRGTLVNGRSLSADRALQSGDEIAIGRTRLVFEPESSAAWAEVSTESQTPSRSGAAEAVPPLIARSPAMRRALADLDGFAASEATILITGETGTGKEVVARVAHARSKRATRPFVVVNCPALPQGLVEAELFGVEKGVATDVAARPGRLEAAQGGTLLLDEIGDLDLGVQAKLLRFLQDRTVERIGGRKPVQLDVRVLAATNRDLPDDVAHGRFRKDLYFRLKAAEIRLPPLRERREDIRPLAEHVLSGVRPRRRLSEAAVAWLEEQPLPGNVRELESLIQVAALRAAGDTIEQTNLGGAAPAGAATAVAGASHSARIAANIFAQLLARVGSFDDLVWRPFADRRLPKDSVRELVRLAREHVGGATGRPVTTKDVARLFGIEARHKKLLDFLRNNGLRPSDQGVDGSPPAGA